MSPSGICAPNVLSACSSVRGELGLDRFDGGGNRGIIRSTGASVDFSYDWTDFSWPSGTYTVDPDCTASLFDADGSKANNIIVLDGGRRFRVLTAGPDGQGKVITGDATRMDGKRMDGKGSD